MDVDAGVARAEQSVPDLAMMLPEVTSPVRVHSSPANEVVAASAHNAAIRRAAVV